MQARRVTRLMDRLGLVAHPAPEILTQRALEAGARRLGRVVGRLAFVLAHQLPTPRLGEAFDEGLEAGRAKPEPRGRVLRFHER
jgi:hypothetical protein